MEALKQASRKNGVIYTFANHKGCTGNRNYYDGNACIFSNGYLLGESKKFCFNNVEIVVANADLQVVKKKRIGVKLFG